MKAYDYRFKLKVSLYWTCQAISRKDDINVPNIRNK